MRLRTNTHPYSVAGCLRQFFNSLENGVVILGESDLLIGNSHVVIGSKPDSVPLVTLLALDIENDCSRNGNDVSCWSKHGSVHERFAAPYDTLELIDSVNRLLQKCFIVLVHEYLEQASYVTAKFKQPFPKLDVKRVFLLQSDSMIEQRSI